jgi:DNA-binding transcriptional regulator YhcF (GntR family)
VRPFQPISLDRAAEVPLGTQLTWVLRARVTGGALAPGERLPGARELAAHVGVNVNTVRAVFARLEEEGLLEVVHGRGTFVADRGKTVRSGADSAARFAAAVTSEARRRGLDPRAVAAALYVETGAEDDVDAATPHALLRGAAGRELPAEDDGDRGALCEADVAQADTAARGALRAEIAALERRLAELPAPAPDGDPLTRPPLPPSEAGRLLTTAELEDERDRLVERVEGVEEGRRPR